MPLTTMTEILRDAHAGGYAVGAFNVENLEMVQAVITTAADVKAPVIVQTTPGTLRYVDMATVAAVVAAEAARVGVPVALHLDHGDTFDSAARAVRSGYTSIMFDGSPLPVAENTEISAAVVRMCHAAGLPVEVEIGRIGGKEDDLVSGGIAYTDPEEAAEFIAATGADSLAVAIGTAHGVYKGVPVLDLELLSVLRDRIDVPLVLHGSSGLSDAAVRDCVARGIAKVNFATELRAGYTGAVRTLLEDKPAAIDPKAFGSVARDAVARIVADRIRVVGSDGKA